MIASLTALAIAVLWVPAIWACQAVFDWWTDPGLRFWRRVWLMEHGFHLMIRDSAGPPAGAESQPAPDRSAGAGTRAAHSRSTSPAHGEPLPGGPGPHCQASDSVLDRGSAPSEPQPVPKSRTGTGTETPVGDRDPRLQSPTGLISPSGWRGQGKSGSANPAAGAALAAAAPVHTPTVGAAAPTRDAA